MPGKKNKQPPAKAKAKGKKKYSNKVTFKGNVHNATASRDVAMSQARLGMAGVRVAAGAASLVRALGLPGDSQPMRVPSYDAPQVTSVVKLSLDMTFDIPTGEHRRYALLTRDPVRPLWLSESGTGVASMKGLKKIFSTDPPAVPTVASASLDLKELIRADDYLSPQSAGSNHWLAGYAPAVDHNNQVWAYAPASYKFYVRIGCSLAMAALDRYTLSVNFTPDLTMKSTGVVDVALGPVGTYLEGVWNADGATAGWFQPSVLSCVFQAAIVQAGVTFIQFGVLTDGAIDTPTVNAGAQPYWAIPAPIGEVENMQSVFRDCRINAVGCLYRNVTSNMYKNGQVTANNVTVNNAGVFGPNYLANTGQTIFHTQHAKLSKQANLRYYGKLEAGFYHFAKPDKESLEFRDWTLSPATGNPATSAAIRMDAFGRYDVVEFADNDSTVSTVMAVTVDYHLEWRNTSQFHQTDVCRTSIDTWHQAQAALVKMPNMFENPLHLRDVARYAKMAADWAAPVLMPHLRGAAQGLASKGLSSLATAMSGLLL